MAAVRADVRRAMKVHMPNISVGASQATATQTNFGKTIVLHRSPWQKAEEKQASLRKAPSQRKKNYFTGRKDFPFER